MTGQSIANGGVQYVPQIAVQYVYLDFDGELTSYDGEILSVDNVEVKDSALTAGRIENILAELNAKYASQNVIFVAEKPAVAEYSTICNNLLFHCLFSSISKYLFIFFRYL